MNKFETLYEQTLKTLSEADMGLSKSPSSALGKKDGEEDTPEVIRKKKELKDTKTKILDNDLKSAKEELQNQTR